MRPLLSSVGAGRCVRGVTSLVLTFVLGSSTAFAQQPIRDAASREASRAAAGQAAQARGKRMMPGALVATAGAVVGVLGATAFRSEKTTSGNTPPDAFAQCEALKSNPVYADNRCDVLKGPNLAMVSSGIAIAAVGLTFMAIGSSRASVEFGPTALRIVRRVKF
jgi:hypothetical protein